MVIIKTVSGAEEGSNSEFGGDDLNNIANTLNGADGYAANVFFSKNLLVKDLQNNPKTMTLTIDSNLGTNKTLTLPNATGTLVHIGATLSSGWSYGIGVKQTFGSGGLNVGGSSTEPSSGMVDGDIYYNLSLEKFRVRENDTWKDMTFSPTFTLATNNTWTGTNTFSNTVTVNSTMTGSSSFVITSNGHLLSNQTATTSAKLMIPAATGNAYQSNSTMNNNYGSTVGTLMAFAISGGVRLYYRHSSGWFYVDMVAAA